MSEQEYLLLSVLGISAALKYGCLILLHRRRSSKDDLELVGRVAEMRLYPIKACCGFSVSEAMCTKAGLQVKRLIDRQFLVANDAGEYISQRLVPRLVLVSPSIHGDQLHMDAPGMETLVLPLHPSSDGPKVDIKVHESVISSIYCGQVASEWLTTFLGESLHLYYHCPSQDAPDLSQAGSTRWHKAGRPGDKAGFHYFGPFLLTCTASLADLNSRLEDQIDMRPFRANIVVDTSKAFDEDSWTEIFIGEKASFSVIKPCHRCLTTTVDQNTAAKHTRQQPLRTLRQYRIDQTASTAPLFGVYPALDTEGVIKVGDPVYALRKNNWWQ